MKNPFRSPQKWIYKYIPKREYADKTYLIPEFLFGCVIEFVESEECFELIDYSTCPKHKRFERDLKLCYNFVKCIRPALQKTIDQELEVATNKLVWKKVEGDDSLMGLKMPDKTYEELYGSYIYELYGSYSFYEKELDKQEQKYMKWIVKNVDHLWT